MPLAPGQTLSFYEILGPLGAGGMGEVYRARDTRLQRDARCIEHSCARLAKCQICARSSPRFCPLKSGSRRASTPIGVP